MEALGAWAARKEERNIPGGEEETTGAPGEAEREVLVRAEVVSEAGMATVGCLATEEAGMATVGCLAAEAGRVVRLAT
eukprot:4065688-Prymnesium_polylepis.1